MMLTFRTQREGFNLDQSALRQRSYHWVVDRLVYLYANRPIDALLSHAYVIVSTHEELRTIAQGRNIT